jgi:prolyl-tRNA synthetase
VYKTDEQLAEITAEVNILIAELKKLHVSVKYDNRTTQKPGFKFAEWELKVPVRCGWTKDLENGTLK